MYSCGWTSGKTEYVGHTQNAKTPARSGNNSFLGGFAKLKKATISFCTSIFKLLIPRILINLFYFP
jgi:hypothetical protein